VSPPTALVAEDEGPQRRELCSVLAELWPELHIVAECSDGLSALEALSAHSPDILFLDIRMPGVSGLEVARAASGSAHVVFTTAYEEHALEAFDRGAIDYLLKPIKRERLAIALDRLRARLAEGAAPDIAGVVEALQRQLSQAGRRSGVRWITANVGATTKMFPIEDVLFFHAQDKYTRVVTAQDEALIRTPLKELAQSLDSDDYWQVHRSVIVRVHAIRAVHRDEDGKLWLQVKGRADQLPVSSAFQYRFKGM
jgi:DNA-binding LytR/AlgR family response regulator